MLHNKLYTLKDVIKQQDVSSIYEFNNCYKAYAIELTYCICGAKRNNQNKKKLNIYFLDVTLQKINS